MKHLSMTSPTSFVITMAFAALALFGSVRLYANPNSDPQSKKDQKGRVPVTDHKALPPVPAGKQEAVIAGGCFWCTEAIFLQLKGVDAVTSGYTGGKKANPTYEEVCDGDTGHAEAVRIIFDPKVLSYKDLLKVFLTTHDPTTLNRQGADSGTQYRSAIFFKGAEQEKVAREVIKEITKAGLWNSPIVTEVKAASIFYAAEDYHQNYFARNPNAGYCRVVIEPKVAKFRKAYFDKLKK